MFEIMGEIPRKVSLAFSGGIDSVAVMDFISRNHEVTLLYFNHGELDVTSDECQAFAESVSRFYKSNLKIGKPTREKHKSESLEEYFRNMRYEWFHSLEDEFIIVCHHLDDAVETFVWSSMHGTQKTVPYKRGNNVYRPFLLNKKKEFERWVLSKNVCYRTDPTNYENDKTRNYIRNVMMPHVLRINPGIHKVVKNKIIAENENNLYQRPIEEKVR